MLISETGILKVLVAHYTLCHGCRLVADLHLSKVDLTSKFNIPPPHGVKLNKKTPTTVFIAHHISSLVGLLGTVARQAFVESSIFVHWVFWCVFPNISLHFSIMYSP